ncbi:MAG: 50S ribosomal protein L4 [Candidatus Bipolaricaulota bacterium]|nr:50S ribosomal protein L4 [Candidatus Bipolaricaulota bacterium]MDW8126275.1 50S ribosomal protein L4 [Candidatus Bipolaricaulota bacterium]
MPKAKLYRFAEVNAEPVEVELPPEVFGVEVSLDLLWRAVRSYLLNQRQGTASTKDRGEVSGGGRKPWPQKHTGRARHGSIRSPLWRHGGVTFGPKPRDWDVDLPKKMRRKALACALSARAKEGQVWLIDRLDFQKPRTKEAVALLSRLGLPEKTLVVVAPEEYQVPVFKSFANIAGVECYRADLLNAYEVLEHDGILLTEAAVKALTRRLCHAGVAA